MLRRHPDAIALAIIGLFALALSIPKTLIRRDTHWTVTPVKVEMRSQQAQMRAIAMHFKAEREAMKARTECIRRLVRY